jgi:16S rRNA (adenine1518-N6/adenine1519-N6)-dimethyltransferase
MSGHRKSQFMFPKKSLGQHFLTNTGIVASIAEAGLVSAGDTVLEIGPGKGILTAELLKLGAAVIAVEKDEELLPFLEEKFKKEISEKQLVLMNADILDFRPETYNLKPKTYKLVANIPYYITGAIIRKFLTEKNQPEKMVLLVQKEVADRIVAKDKKESLLSISVKVYGAPKYIKTVKSGSFTPPPKVDSAILLIDNISREFFSPRTTLSKNFTEGSPWGASEEKFFEVLHAGFAHKRKQLFGNLKAVFDEKILREKMATCNILENARAESLSAEDWRCLIQ